MSWLNLNESLSNIKGQISNFATGVLADGIVNDTDPFAELSTAQQKIQELQNLCANQEAEISNLRRQNAEFYEKLSFSTKSKNETQDSAVKNGENWFWDPPEEKPENKRDISNLIKQIENLEVEKRDLIQSLEQLDQDCQRTTDKLVTLKDNLQTDYNKLKNDFDWLKNENEELSKENDRLKRNLSNHLEEIQEVKTASNSLNNGPLKINFKNLQKEKQALEKNLSEINSQLATIQNNYDKLKLESVSLENFNKLSKDFDTLQTKYSDLELQYESNIEKTQKLYLELKEYKNCNLSDDHKKLNDELIIEKQEMHKKYITILTEMVKKYVDYEIPEEFAQNNENIEMSEFTSKIEAVLKLLLDFKWKTETLERKLCEISHEKGVAITEKNHEIEKLLHNSEILSQEVITKTQTIKDYEIECSELIKNNDLLIAELQQYKNNGLQTISETNEDNLLLLETQLEQSNKRVRELELLINDMENSKQDVAVETQTELDYIKKQLNLTGKELSQSKIEYKELLKHYKQLEAENKNLTTDLSRIKINCDTIADEKQNLELLVEKLKAEIENTEYKFTETNVNFESLKEELQNLKFDISNLSNSNENLTSLNKQLNKKNEILQAEINSLKSQLDSVVSIKNQIEHQNRNLTEKLQSSKMSETGLKLQFDTIKRELDSTAELNVSYDKKIKNFEHEYIQISNAFHELISSSNLFKDIEALNNENLSLTQKIKHHYKSFEMILKQNENTTHEKVSENVSHLENKIQELSKQNSELVSVKEELEHNLMEAQNINKTQNETYIQNLEQEKSVFEIKIKDQNDLINEIDLLNSQLEQLNVCLQEKSTTISNLESEINKLNISKSELVGIVTTKHQENIQYHAEIQRLNKIIAMETEKNKQPVDNTTIEQKNTEIEKLTDQNNFLREKCEKLTQNLLEEQSNTQKIISERQMISEREQSLTRELERLRLHLVEIEDNYVRELLQAEENNKEMQAKVNEIEQRERDSSTIYTSVSIRTNQQVETLQNQLQLVTAQRDDLQKKISEAEDRNNKQFAALTNLQCVLEQFQKDREKDIMSETERVRRQITIEQQKQNVLQEEIDTLKAQLVESKQGLKAAARLTEQVEKSKHQVSEMKTEVTKLQDQLSRTEEKYKKLLSETGVKVDKSLIKNLIIGFISANNNLSRDQSQILKIIATVLDFSPQDNEKLNLNKNAGSWLPNMLHPATGSTQQSLSEAFVRFLESESQPKPVPPPLLNMRKMSTDSNASTASNSTKTPVLLSEVVLPTFADFAQNRNSSSILKDVLKEN